MLTLTADDRYKIREVDLLPRDVQQIQREVDIPVHENGTCERISLAATLHIHRGRGKKATTAMVKKMAKKLLKPQTVLSL